MTAGETPTSGWFDAGEHRFPLRVFYEDTDAAGIVYYANYLKFAERARTEAMRLLGLDHSAFARDEARIFVVRRVEVDYLVPARLDDSLVVRTRFTEMGGAYVDALQRVCRGEEVLARLFMRVVCMTGAARPARIPAPWRRQFEPLLSSGEAEGARGEET